MKIDISQTKLEAGVKAAHEGAEHVRRAIASFGKARIVLAAAASQFEMFAELVTTSDIDWSKVTAFHLDEYAGMSMTHPASFRRYLQERFIQLLPQPLAAFHAIRAEGDLEVECHRLGELVKHTPIDVAFIGIGENGHIAFNDPPADFTTDSAYTVVELDDICRRQQLGEGWFPTLDDVPTRAISMSVPQILRSKRIVCTVPDRRKAEAVRNTVQGPVTPDVPASVMQEHPCTTLYLDRESASMLTSTPRYLRREGQSLAVSPARDEPVAV